MTAPAASPVRRWAGRPGLPVPLLASIGIALLLLGVGLLASRLPALGVALAAAVGFGFFPRLCRAVLILIALIAPTFNPAVLGIGAGRLYLAQALIVGVVAGSLALALRSGMASSTLTLLTLVALLVIVETVGRPNAGLAWVYRPLQVFLVAFAVRALFQDRSDRPLVMALAWGSMIGCLLGSIHAILPAIDPFVLSRPRDLPFVSAIGSYARATGAFTYPNNLGTFAAYTALFGASAWLLDRPLLPRRLAAALMASGAAALTLAGSRAAGLGLLCGLLYLTVRAAPQRRTVILGAEALFGVLIVVVVLSSPTATEVVTQRVQSATGESFFGRVESFKETIDAFRRSPLVGTGSSASNLDNFVILYVTQAGVVGALLLIGIARTALSSGASKRYPELWMALVIALCTSGMLQDSLGQTLVTWFLGALLGVSMLGPQHTQPRVQRTHDLTPPAADGQRVATTR